MAYPNLSAEMARHNVTDKDIAERIGCTPDSVRNWIRGKSDFQVQNAFLVQEEFFPMYPLKYLFCKKAIPLGAFAENDKSD